MCYYVKYKMFQNIRAMQNCNVSSVEARDSVEDFINTHSVKDDMSTGSIRRLQKDIHSVMVESCADNESFKEYISKPGCQYAKETVSKLVKYLTKLDQLAFKHTQGLRREKQNRDLRKFIKFLRYKHLSDAASSASIQSEQWSTSSEFIDTCDYKLLWQLYRDLNDLITKHKDRQPKESTSKFMSVYNIPCENVNINPKDIKKPLFESELICFPTSSSYKRITKLQREMGHTNLCSYLSSGAAAILNYPNSRKKDVIKVPAPLKSCQPSPQKSKSKFHNTKLTSIIKQESTNDLHKKKIKENNKNLEKENPSYLLDIESKIDSLVNSINLLIAEIQVKQTTITNKNESTPKVFTKISNNELDTLKKDVMGKQNELILLDSFSNNIKPVSLQTTEEIVKLDENKLLGNIIKITNDAGTNTNNNVSFADKISVGFMVKTSTSEKAVEANEPLAEAETKAPVSNTEEKSTTAHKDNIDNTNTGANTEPLGILSLWKVSTATVRQLLSLVPAFDYYSYLPLPQSAGCTDSEEPHYVCNICGAAFDKASTLNDHIKGHDLGFARNCCTCQRVLNSETVRRQELFRCQFCGERFTRAYCRELHQQGCAKRLGVPPEVASGLILLR